MKQNRSFTIFPDFVAIQLSDTHPSTAILELVSILINEEELEWEEAEHLVQQLNLDKNKVRDAFQTSASWAYELAGLG